MIIKKVKLETIVNNLYLKQIITIKIKIQTSPFK